MNVPIPLSWPLTGTLFLTAMLGGCDRTRTFETTGTSVSKLRKTFPVLEPYEIESCRYTVEKSVPTSTRLPAPSDRRLKATGSMNLSQDGAEALKSKFEWKPVPRTEIPEALSATMPAGDVLISTQLNEKFVDNPVFRHGFAAVLESEGWSTVYFLATDMDHPL